MPPKKKRPAKKDFSPADPVRLRRRTDGESCSQVESPFFHLPQTPEPVPVRGDRPPHNRFAAKPGPCLTTHDDVRSVGPLVRWSVGPLVRFLDTDQQTTDQRINHPSHPPAAFVMVASAARRHVVDMGPMSCSLAAVRELTVSYAGDPFTIEIATPDDSAGLVLLAHHNGNALRRCSVAGTLREFGFATATCEILTRAERASAVEIARAATNLRLLLARLSVIVAGIRTLPAHRDEPVGIVASGTLAAAALTYAARHPHHVGAVVSRGGRVDLVADAEAIRCPTLLIAGGEDTELIRANELLFQRLGCTKSFAVLAGASHRLDQPASFELASRLTADWFATHMTRVLA